jgi:hypothetical protein
VVVAGYDRLICFLWQFSPTGADLRRDEFAIEIIDSSLLADAKGYESLGTFS